MQVVLLINFNARMALGCIQGFLLLGPQFRCCMRMVRMWPANGKDVALVSDPTGPIIAAFFVATLIVSYNMCMLCA